MTTSADQIDGRTATAAEIIAGHDLSGRRAIVTGGYGGVGYETSRALAGAGADVVIAGRDPARGADAVRRLEAETGNGSIVFSQLDLRSLDTVRAWAAAWTAGGSPVHLLVNNAAVMWPPQRRTDAGFDTQLAVNHLAHMALTLGLLPCLQAAGDARVVILTSSAHRRSDIDYDDPNYDRRPYDPAQAYGQSKTANALFAVGFTARFAGPQLTANAVMPGAIRSGLMRNLDKAELRSRGWIDADGNDLREGWKSPEQGAATTIWAAVSPELDGVSGRYLEDCAVATPLVRADRPLGGNYDPQGQLRGHYQPYALDPENADRLWALSERLIGSAR
jgi:NAD(P)-dependent dehydrogenase (short-subunit alcohol dehydrogenase family)